MTKLEKAIKGFEVCLSGGLPGRCHDCPYHRDGCAVLLQKDALELLKTQREWCKSGHRHGNAQTWVCTGGERR